MPDRVIRAATAAERRAEQIRNLLPEAWRLQVRDLVPPTGRPTIRAATWSERLSDWVRNAYEGAAAHPLGRMSDVLGLTDLAGMVESATNPPLMLRGEVPDAPPGKLFSRVERVAAQVPAKGVHPNKLASLLRSGASQEEVAYRKLPELLAGKGNAPVTAADLEAHLAAHPAPMPALKTLGSNEAINAELNRVAQQNNVLRAQASEATMDLNPTIRANIPHWARDVAFGGQTADSSLAKIQALPLSDEAKQLILEYGRGIHQSSVLNEAMLGTRTKYAQYQLPGGEAYRETLLTLPERGPRGGPPEYDIKPAANGRGFVFTDRRTGELVGGSSTREQTEANARAWAATNPPPAEAPFA